MQDCIFCRLVRREIPASIVYEDDAVIAFMDIGQVNPGHVIVASRAHHRNLLDLDEALAGECFRVAARIAKAVKKATGCAGLNLFQANEAAGFQTVYHFHLHVLPRHANDGLKLVWPTQNPPREALDRMAGEIRAALA
ncbi:MAG: HIT family protein [Pseudomonadota bacterium]